MPTHEPHYVIAIGASAGGLEELNLFFDYTPVDDVSYVIVQHLSSDFKSRMAELLARHSKLEIKEVENGMLIKRNTVYLIPHDKFMTVSSGALWLTEKSRERGPHMTINVFFKSLAESYANKAIAVVLSGLGSDGSDGVREIKKAEGMVIARQPSTSNFGSMPSGAIATGLVDFILEPQAMPGVIEDYIKYGEDFLSDSSEDEKNLTEILAKLHELLPLDYSEYKRPFLMRRIKRRAGHLDFHRLDDYLNYLSVTSGEAEALSAEFLISVTSFFRDPLAFKVLEDVVIPQIIKDLEPGEELKIWVAGCASGEEAYSIAILLSEQLSLQGKVADVKIFATDIDSAALKFAAKGIYKDRIKQEMSAERLERFFTMHADQFLVKPGIRKMVIFAHHDLTKNPPYRNMHLISCRNLLIYMTAPLQKKALDFLLFGLRSEGYLFLGTSESAFVTGDRLAKVDVKWKIFQNTTLQKATHFDAFATPTLPVHNQVPFVANTRGATTLAPNAFAEEGLETLVKALDYLVLFIDENKEVIQSFGDTSQFLFQRNFKQNLEDLLPSPLSIALAVLIQAVLSKNESVQSNEIQITLQEKVHLVNVKIIPLKARHRTQRMLLVLFTKSNSDPIMANLNFNYDEREYLTRHNAQLSLELKTLKVTLEEANQKVNESDENIHSFNEELLSANEEMQSTNEEMQSVNEELHTINSDYQLKNRELAELNDDLNNFFKSNINGQLFVNRRLELVRFSPGAVKQINLLPSDIGRPLSNISTNIRFENIENDIKAVIAEGTIITKEVQTHDGQWYQIMTMPYVKESETREGAIITFNNVTALKNVQGALDSKINALVRINADLETFVYAASHDLLAPLGNIEGSIEAIHSMPVGDLQSLQLLKIIDISIKKFKSLIKDISDIARVEGETVHVELIKLSELFDSIEWSLADTIHEKNAFISRDLQVESLRFSQKNLRSILFNLISNALKFSKGDRPQILISSKVQGSSVIVTVADDGIGMAEAELGSIFELYGRLHEEVDGQGVGLFLARKLVHTAGGTLTVKSTLGSGSEFQMSLPSEEFAGFI